MEKILEVEKDQEVLLVSSKVSFGRRFLRKVVDVVAKEVYSKSKWVLIFTSSDKAIAVDFSQYPRIIEGAVCVSCLRYLLEDKKRYPKASILNLNELNELEKGMRLYLEAFMKGVAGKRDIPQELFTPRPYRILANIFFAQAVSADGLRQLYPDSAFSNCYNTVISMLIRKRLIDDKGKNLLVSVTKFLQFLLFHQQSCKKPEFRYRVCPKCLEPHIAIGSQVYCDEHKHLRTVIKERLKKYPELKEPYKELLRLCRGPMMNPPASYQDLKDVPQIEKLQKLQENLGILFREKRGYRRRKRSVSRGRCFLN